MDSNNSTLLFHTPTRDPSVHSRRRGTPKSVLYRQSGLDFSSQKDGSGYAHDSENGKDQSGSGRRHTSSSSGPQSSDPLWDGFLKNVVPNEELLTNLLCVSEIVERSLFTDQPPKLDALLRLAKASGDYIEILPPTPTPSPSFLTSPGGFPSMPFSPSVRQAAAAPAAPISEFVCKKVIGLPDAIRDQYSLMKRACFLGIFPEISRAWLSIDNKLFLWNYVNTSDFCYYDELDEYNVIIGASVVKARPGVFRPGVEHLLVLTTPILIVILAIAWQGGAPSADPASGQALHEPVDSELVLLPIHMSVPSDNVNMLSISSADNGRIFLTGNDGCLYEIVYQAQDGWFTKRCRKINHSTSTLSSLVPSFLKFRAPIPLIDSVVDSARGVLYTLSEQSVVSVFDLGQDLAGLRHVQTSSSIHSECARLCPREPSFWDRRSFQIASLHVVHEEGPVHVVALTTSGIRLFFSTFDDLNSTQNASRRPTSLTLIHARFPPRSSLSSSIPSSSSSSNLQTPSSSSTSSSTASASSRNTSASNSDSNNSGQPEYGGASYCEHGIYLLSNQSVSDNYEVVLGLSHTTSHLQQTASALASGNAGTDSTGSLTSAARASSYRRRLDKFYETNSAFTVPGTIHAISEIPLPQQHSSQGKRGLWQAQTAYNELATQHALPPRRLLCLTNNALHVYIKLRPVDELYGIFTSVDNPVDSDALLNFFAKYGAVESRTLCLTLACATQSSPFDRSVNSRAALPAVSPATIGSSGPIHPSAPASSFQALAAPSAVAPPFAQSAFSVWSPGLIPLHIRVASAKAFFRANLSPESIGNAPQISTHAAPDYGVGFAVTRPEISHSDKHSGLCLYLARLLRPIWNDKIFVPINKGSNDTHTSNNNINNNHNIVITNNNNNNNNHNHDNMKLLETKFSGEGLLYVSGTLSALLTFLKEHREFTSPPDRIRKRPNPHHFHLDASSFYEQEELDRRGRASFVDPIDETELAEKKSLWNIHLLTLRSQEALEFILALTHFHDFNQILSFADQDDLIAKLTRISFQQFVCTQDGVALTKTLVAMLVRYYTHNNRPIEEVSLLLHQKCPSFFGQQDKDRFRAYELINQAKYDPSLRERLLDESLRIFEKIAAFINLQEIASRYIELHYYPGLITLALACARALDPQGLAANWNQQPGAVSSPAPASSTSQGPNYEENCRVAYQSRFQCYQVILNAFSFLLAPETAPAIYGGGSDANITPLRLLDQDTLNQLRQAALVTAMTSKDVLFHQIVYNWYISNNLLEELIAIDSPYLEDFLRHLAQENPARMDLLANFYTIHRQPSAAAAVLAKLAELQLPDRTLKTRIEDLSRAVIALKSSSALTTASGAHSAFNPSPARSVNDDGDEYYSRYRPRQRTGQDFDPYGRLNPMQSQALDGELLQELEEKLELAQIQDKILQEMISNRHPQLIKFLGQLEVTLNAGATPDAAYISKSARLIRLSPLGDNLFQKTSSTQPTLYLQPDLLRELNEVGQQMTRDIRRLNERLFTLSELFNQFTFKYRLWELCLMVFECSSHNDPELVKSIWHHILLEECELNGESIPAQREALHTKIVTLGKEFQAMPSPIAFPIAELCHLLEKFSYQCGDSMTHTSNPATWVINMMRSIPIPFPDLFDVYDRMFIIAAPLSPTQDPSRDASNRETQLHLLKSIHALLEMWIYYLTQPNTPAHEKRFFELKQLADSITKYINQLREFGTVEAQNLARAFHTQLSQIELSRSKSRSSAFPRR